MMVWRDRGVASTAASLPLLLCCYALLVLAVLAHTENEPAQDGVAMSRLSKRSAFVFPSEDDDTYIPDGESTPRNDKTSSSLDEDRQRQRPRSSSGKKISFPVDEEQQEVVIPAAGTGRTSNGRGFFRRSGTVNGDGASGSSDQLMKTLSSLVSLLPRDQKNAAAATADTNTRQAFDGFRLSDLMPDGLSALEGLDDLLRSTVPRMDRFNCLERVMCEMAAPLGIGGGGDGGNFIEDGIQTLQQISNSPLLQQFPDRLFQEGSQQPQFARPHQQQFLQQQQHQTRLIRQQVQQQQVQPQQLPQQPVIPPLPYYIPTPLEASQQQFREQQENLVARGSSDEERTQYENTIRRDERYPAHQYQYQQQHQPSQQVYQYQEHPHQQGQHQQYQTNQPYQYQQASIQYPQYAPQNGTPFRRRRQPPAWRRIFNNFMGIGQNGSGGPSRRRGKRDVEESQKPVSSRQSKIAPIFKSEEGRVESLQTRQSKISPEFKTTDVAGAKRKEEGPAPVKTLTKADLDDIRKKIASINNDVLQNANSNGTSSVTFQGRQYSGRQARFLDTLLNGWTAKSLLGVLDNLMDGYSFHPYTHAAYMGYTSRSGTCSTTYPRCPDSANDMLDLVNNIHRYFPGGLPFKDSIPWPLSLLIP